MKQYRNSLQITESILQATDTDRSGVQVTTLMIKSNLSYQRLTKILTDLTSSGLINKIEVSGKNTFVITSKGRIYLEEYKKFESIARSFGLEM